MLPQCRCADGFCCVPRMTKGKSVVRAALDVSLLPWEESGPGCPSDDGTRHWSGARAAVRSQPGRMLRSQHHHPRWDEGAAGTDPSRAGDWGAGWHPPICPMNIVSRGSSSSILPGLGKPRWVSEGHPKRVILWAPAECTGGVSAFFCADKEPEGAGAQPGTGGHGTQGGEPTATHTLRSTARGSQALGQNLGGDPAFAGGVTGSPSTALCTPAAFQAKPPPTCCVNTARSRSLEKSFLLHAAPKLWREAQHLPLTMRLTTARHPAAFVCSWGCCPLPGHPTAPCAPTTAPAAPLAPTTRAETKPVVGESTRLLATDCLAWVLFSSDASRIESSIVSYVAASGGDGAASCAGLCSPRKEVTRTKRGSCTGQDGCMAPSWLSVQSPRLTALLLQRRWVFFLVVFFPFLEIQ